MASLLLSAVLHVSRYSLAAGLPPVFASVIALTGAALVGWSLRLDGMRFAAVAVIAGVSPMVVAMANPEGYADTMLALAIGVAGLVAAAVVAEHGRGYVVAALLLAMATVVHSATGAVLGAMLIAVVVVYAVQALVTRDRAGSYAGSVAARLAFVLGGAVVVWAAILAVAVRVLPDTYRAPVARLEEKLRSHWPRLGFPVAVPAGAAGAILLAQAHVAPGAERRRRFLLTLLLAWLGVIGLALAAWFAGWKLPVHRFLLLTLPLPLLGAIALLWVSDRVDVHRHVLRAVVLAAGCLAVAVPGYILWARNAAPTLRSARLDEARAAIEYVKALPRAGTVAVVTDPRVANPDVLAQTVRVVTPVELLSSLRFPQRIPASTPPDRVVLLMKEFSAEFEGIDGSMPGREVTPGVLVLVGPLPPRPLPTFPGPRLGTGFPGLLGIGTLVMLLLGAVGSGWSARAFADLRPLERLAVAPAVGLAVVVADGLLLDVVGARIGGVPGVAVVVVSAGLGLLLARGRPVVPEEPTG
jgi:hypothetical protein